MKHRLTNLEFSYLVSDSFCVVSSPSALYDSSLKFRKAILSNCVWTPVQLSYPILARYGSRNRVSNDDIEDGQGDQDYVHNYRTRIE